MRTTSCVTGVGTQSATRTNGVRYTHFKLHLLQFTGVNHYISHYIMFVPVIMNVFLHIDSGIANLNLLNCIRWSPPRTANSCKVPLGYVCDGSVTSGSLTTTCASPMCANAFIGPSITGGATSCTTGTGSDWSLSGCSGRPPFEYERHIIAQSTSTHNKQVIS